MTNPKTLIDAALEQMGDEGLLPTYPPEVAEDMPKYRTILTDLAAAVAEQTMRELADNAGNISVARIMSTEREKLLAQLAEVREWRARCQQINIPMWRDLDAILDREAQPND